MNKEKMLIRYSLLLFVFCLSASVSAQDVCGFVDKAYNYFYVFDRGTIQKLDHNPVSNIKVGGDYVLFINIKEQLKMYKDGKDQIVEHFPAINYFPTRHLLVSLERGDLAVIEDYKREYLSTLKNPVCFSSDSLIVFNDFDNYFKAYYDKEVIDLEVQEVLEVKINSNTAAYVNKFDELRVFYDGYVETIEENIPKEYEVGLNKVAYINRYDEFLIYDEGEIKNLEPLSPLNFIMGFHLLAYVDRNEVFKIYENGKTKELQQEQPTFFNIKQNTLVYVDDLGYLNVYYKGENHTLEAYRPEEMYYDEGIVVYKDYNGQLKAFYEGKKVVISEELVNNFSLKGRVILYTKRNKRNWVYWNYNHYHP